MPTDFDRMFEAAQDGVRLLVAEALRLETDMDVDPRNLTAEIVSSFVRRAGMVASRAVAVLTTLSDDLPVVVGAEVKDAYAEGKRDGKEIEHEAWADGVQAGMDVLRPTDGQPAH